MSKEIYISSTPHETRLAIVEKDELSEIYYERENEYTLAGSIYNGKVTRVLPGMQSAFVDVGLERDAFLYITDFLEEQGESADFESGDARRGGGERKEERSGERGRGDRNGRGRDQPRGEQREISREAVSESSEPAEPAFSQPEEVLNETASVAEPAEDNNGEGSRQWRGRRGRRRGRGGEGRPVAPAANISSAPLDEPVLLSQDEPEPEVLESVQSEAQPAAESSREGRSGKEQGGRSEQGRDRNRGGERGGRGRDKFGDRGRRSESVEAAGETNEPTEEPLILPGESLSKYRRGDEGGTSGSASASVSSQPQTTYLTARPSTELNISAANWDGGSVLPGETLSRHRSRPADEVTPLRAAEVQSSAAAQNDAGSADDSGKGRDRRRERDRKRGRGSRPEAGEPVQAAEEPTPTSFSSGVNSREQLDPAEAVQPGVTSQHEPEDMTLTAGADFVEGVRAPDFGNAGSFLEGEIVPVHPEGQNPLALDLAYEPETDFVASAGPSERVLEAVEQMHAGLAVAAEPAAVQAPEEFHEETTEYEPEDSASASYRVDPAGPSEFRQSSLADDELNLTGNRFDEGMESSPKIASHEFTAIEASGEMLSGIPDEIADLVIENDAANPIEHETVVQSVHLGDAEDTPEFTSPSAPQASASAQTFEPGEGQLEEELLDDDEHELVSMSASYGDETEEETFEAGAEIGSLVRDRALDQMTQTDNATAEAEDEDEDDFDISEEEMEEDELDESEEIASGDVSDLEEDEAVDEGPGFEEEGEKPAAAAMGEFPEFTEEGASLPRRDRGNEGSRPEGNRESRRGSEGRDRGGRGGRDRRGMANSRPSGGGGGGGRPNRHSVQNTDLPAISDLLKPGQEVLVQIAKEPIAKKGARITSHIALPGRFLVFMPTVNHVGVSRKIESDGERRRLKEILLSEKGEAAGGFIVRTAALGASEEELRSDLRFLLNLWADIKQRSEASKSPALIYHDLNLVERILRDQVTDTFSAIWVDTEDAYERVLRFLQRFQPSLMRRVKLYTKDTPLFEQFGISEEINKALRSKVWLKSGGSIVINQTEALVAIDINTGKFVGKTARLEDTIVKTNLDAIPEIVRQIRLRDLGGIIVIDFIDMDDRKNRAKVLAALEEELKADRAPSKVLQFNDFGLVAITRKRVKQSLERTLSTTCGICAGTGMTKSPITVCNEIYIELRKMHKQLDKGDVMLRVNPEVVKQLKSGNGKWLQEMEEISGKTILVKSDPSLHPEQFDIH
ncbi:MAG: Rne/Rng family ribonuclease [Janthinobacterium lividum]